MPQEPTNGEIMESVQSLAESVQSLTETLQTFATHVDGRFEDLESRMATKDDISKVNERISGLESRMATKDDLAKVKDELIGHIDGLVVLYKNTDVEVLTVRSRCDRIEEFDAKVADKLGIEYIPF